MDDKVVSPVGNDAHPLGFVASETSLCLELETSVAHCLRTGQVLVIHSAKALDLARDLGRQHPRLQIVVDTRTWRRESATKAEPLADVDNLLGLDGWCSLKVPVDSGLLAFAPTKFVGAEDRAARRAVLAATTDLPPNIKTLIATDAAVLDAKLRGRFFEDLENTPERPFTFIFAAKSNPLTRYQRLKGLRLLLQRHPGSGIAFIDPLVAGDAVAAGAGWVGMGASSSRRLPIRPEDIRKGRNSAGFLPGLFHLDLFELRSPQIYADWYANSPSPFCGKCARALDLFEPELSDKAAIVAHNLHQATDHVNELLAQPVENRPSWLNEQRLAALDRHMELNPALGDTVLNDTLRHLLELRRPRPAQPLQVRCVELVRVARASNCGHARTTATSAQMAGA